MRHIALNVADPQASKAFYTTVLGMSVEWEPDTDNVYLTSGGQDNLALHRAEQKPGHKSQLVDHIGFMMLTEADVDQWYQWVVSKGAEILRMPKKHRDGAYSFYFKDPDGLVIQMIFHPPVAKQVGV